jgi:MoaA/NifB/PqqE/SkfB family radical SAM enzyme
MGYSLGIGLTNDCNLSCAHCYRETDRIDHITLEQIRRICEAIDIESVGMGTGENALNPEFLRIVSYLANRRVKLSVASNGYTLTSIPEEILSAFHDVEVSIDFPTQAEQDAFRGPGNWALVHQAIERCQLAGVEVSILATMMRVNYDKMDRLVSLARQNGVNLRVNAYQAVKTDAYRLAYEQFWAGYQRLFSAGLVVSCSEPVVRATMGLDGVRSPCGHNSIRVNPRGQVIPCVYWPVNPFGTERDHRPPTLEDLAAGGELVLESAGFQSARKEPPAAATCACRGGCASRRALNRNLEAHDDYCPWVRGDDLKLEWKAAPAKDLMRSSNVCTTIVV